MIVSSTNLIHKISVNFKAISMSFDFSDMILISIPTSEVYFTYLKLEIILLFMYMILSKNLEG